MQYIVNKAKEPKIYKLNKEETELVLESLKHIDEPEYFITTKQALARIEQLHKQYMEKNESK